MNRMVLIVYNEAIEIEVMDTVAKCGLENYTKIADVLGRGESSGAHLGNDVWPGKNNLLYVACEKEKSQRLLSCIRNLRDTLGKEGVKAFSWAIEDIT